MGIYRSVQCSYWEDPEIIDDFTPEDRYFYLYLFTNPHTTQCGIYQISIRQMALELGYSNDAVHSLIKRFEEKGKIKYSWDTKEIAIKNWPKYNYNSSPALLSCVKKELQLVKDTELISYLFDDQSRERPWWGSIEGLQGVYRPSGEKEKEKEKEKETQEQSADVIRLTNLLYQQIMKNMNPTQYRNKPPSLKKWYPYIEKLHRIDGVPIADIESMIYWCTIHDFWAQNILSAKNLRKHYQKMEVQKRKMPPDQKKPAKSSIPVFKAPEGYRD